MFNSSRIIKNTRLNKLYKQNLLNPTQANQAWELTFDSEILWDGHQIKFIAVTDSHKQEVLAIEATEMDLPLEAQLLRILGRLQRSKKLPQSLVYDHSSFISIELDKWCRTNGVKQVYFYSGNTLPNLFLTRFARKRNSSFLLSFNRKSFNF